MWLPKKVFWSPQSLILDITNNCNLHCIMCRPQNLKKESFSWNYLDFLYITNQFAPRSVSIGVTGEPLLNTYLGSMIKRMYNKRVKIILNTNGTLLKNSSEWINQVNLLKLSIDSNNETIYKKIRRNNNFVELIDSIKKISRSKKPKIRLEYVVMSTNYREMSDFIKFCKELNVTCFFRLLEKLQLPDQDIKNFTNVPNIESEFNKALVVAKKLNVQTNLPNLCKKIQYIKQIYTGEKITDNRRNHICLLPWTQLFVRADGETGPCCNLLDISGFSMGNIFKTENIWNSQKMMELRKLFLQKRNYDVFPTCAKCEYLYWKQLLIWTNLVPGWFR